MARLVYWYAECKDDADCYSIIAKTRKECLEKMTSRHEMPVKKCIEYTDAFDLFEQVTAESGGRAWGYNTQEQPK